MKNITVKDVLRECDGTLLCGDENIVLENFSKDTRAITKGDIYLGIKGEKVDGNLLYKDAIDRGAKVCILDNIVNVDEKYSSSTIIKVENTTKAIQKLAKYKRSLYDIPVIGITGSVGKTSTKDMISSVISKKYNVLKTEGNFNNELGMPLTILRLKDHEAMVLEMGTDKFGDLSLLTDIAKPTICVFTIIGTSHIANFGSRDNILKGKMEILEGLKDKGTIILNNDNDMLSKWHKEEGENYIDKGYNIVTYGINDNSDFMARNIQVKEDCSIYDVEDNNIKFSIEVPVSGKHNVYNSLAAVSVGKLLNISINDIAYGIKEFKLTKMRMDIDKFDDNILLINAAYNASFESMEASIEYLASINIQNKVAILGDMLELGKFSQELHRKVGKCIAKNNINKLVVIGSEAKFIADEAQKQGMSKNNIYYFKSNIEIENVFSDILKENTAILIKASRGMKLDEVYNKIVNTL